MPETWEKIACHMFVRSFAVVCMLLSGGPSMANAKVKEQLAPAASPMKYEQCQPKSAVEKSKAKPKVSMSSRSIDNACPGLALDCKPVSQSEFFENLAKRPTNIIPEACMLGALTHPITNDPRISSYSACRGKPPKPHNVARKSCVDEKFLSSVHEDFETAVECAASFPKPSLWDNEERISTSRAAWDEMLKDRSRIVREMFTLLSHESHFHPNVHSDTWAWGAGQLTSVATEEINSHYARYFCVDSTKDECKHATAPACAMIEPALSGPIPNSPNSARACASISPPQSPARNVVYGALLYLNAKLMAHVRLSKWLTTNPKLADADDRNRVTTMLAQWTYNAGPGILGIAATFVREKGNRQLTPKEFHRKFKAYLRENFTEMYPGQLRQVVGYVDGISESQRSIECLAQGLSQYCQPQKDRPELAAGKDTVCGYDALK